jgi:peptidyl-prolyl cis-trans isomerase D
MALIQNLRNRMGLWVVIFVFVAIISFTLDGIINNGNFSYGNSDREVGEIAGHDVSIEEYQAVLQEREANYYLSFGRQPGEREMPTLRQQAWELLILRHAIQKEFDRLGVEVTTEELKDMVYGKNVDENIKQAFTDQNTGEFDRTRLISYLKELEAPPANATADIQNMWQQQRTRWELFQRDLKPGRERIKYENLILKASFVTTAEAQRHYHAKTDVAEVKYVYVPYYTVADSAVKPSDAELQSFYNKNKDRYKTEESRSIRFVSFAVTPTAKDSLALRNDMNRIARELKETQEDSAYAASNSDGAEAFVTLNAGNLPENISKDDLVVGNVIGPIVDGSNYKVIKVNAVTKDTIYSARASHILIKWENESDAAKKAAKEKARGILKEIKAGADFAAKAMEHGTDGTRTRGGDLGWFTSGKMVKPFENAVFGATKPGLLNDVVETDFGYHIIKVTNVKDNVAYKLAVVERALGPSNETINNAYRQAEAFAADLSGVNKFEVKAKQQNLVVQDAKDLKVNDRSIGNSGQAREVVRWAYNDDTEVGDVSPVFDLEDQKVVAVLTGATEKGYRTFESVKAEITPEVRKEAQGKVIISKLQGLEGTLEEIAQKYGSDANVYSASDLKLNPGSLPSAGFEPKIAGLALSLEANKRTGPVAGENGVFILEVQNKTLAPEITDVAQYKAELEEGNLNRSSYFIAEAIKENAKIEDRRYRFH